MNIPLGGFGNKSIGPFPDVISLNGSFGHVYFYYMSPSPDRPGGIMVGVEGSEFGKRDQSGNLHTLSAKSPTIGVTNGYKWRGKQYSLQLIGGPDKYDSLIVDLCSTGWNFLVNSEWQDSMLFETAKPPKDIEIDAEEIM